MGTLSENQAQEHNEEENRSGREDLGAGAPSKEKARERLGGPSESGRDFGPVTWRQQASRPQSYRPRRAGARSLRPRHSPQGASRQGLLLTREPVVFSFSFGFCFPSVFPLPPPSTPPAWEPHRDVCHQQTRERREPSPLPGSAEMTHDWRLKNPFGGDLK